MAPSATQIKINALTRLVKEEGLYKKEAEEIKAKVDQMKKDNADPYEIKKMEEVFRDTEKMIPNIRKTIQSTLYGLEQHLVSIIFLISPSYLLTCCCSQMLKKRRLLKLKSKKFSNSLLDRLIYIYIYIHTCNANFYHCSTA